MVAAGKRLPDISPKKDRFHLKVEAVLKTLKMRGAAAQATVAWPGGVALIQQHTRHQYEAHDIAQQVHDDIEQDFPNVKHCMVHVNPA